MSSTLQTSQLWLAVSPARRGETEAKLLDTTDLAQVGLLEMLYERVRSELGAEAQLYISGYEQEAAWHIPANSNSDAVVEKFTELVVLFADLPESHKHPDYFEARRILGRPYPGKQPRAVYCWAVAPSQHTQARPPAA